MVAPTGTSQELSGLDQALQTLRENADDATCQSKYYDLFLNTTFCVPTLDPRELDNAPALEEGQALPLVIESDGNDYLMLFDSQERLKSWATDDVTWVGVPGHILAATSMPPLHWALNVGSEYSKQFHPDEIAWLRGVVERCNAAAAAEELSP